MSGPVHRGDDEPSDKVCLFMQISLQALRASGEGIRWKCHCLKKRSISKELYLDTIVQKWETELYVSTPHSPTFVPLVQWSGAKCNL